jgi:hypothetical protein
MSIKVYVSLIYFYLVRCWRCNLFSYDDVKDEHEIETMNCIFLKKKVNGKNTSKQHTE